MKTNILIISILLFTAVAFAQKTKKVTSKNEYPSYQETYYVLKSDQSVRNGDYKKVVRGKTLIKGHFENGIKSGIWEYYSPDGKLMHKFDVVTNELVFDHLQDEAIKFDTTKYTRPLILLGGMASMYIKIFNTLRYPSAARRKGTQGRVFITLTIDEQGNLKDSKILQGIGDGCDEETIKIFKLMQLEWLPALDLEGKPTSSEITLPVSFRLG